MNSGGWCECSARFGGCGRRFTGLTGFDAHRIIRKNPYDWRCATDAELRERGYSPSSRKGWGKDLPRPSFYPSHQNQELITV